PPPLPPPSSTHHQHRQHVHSHRHHHHHQPPPPPSSSSSSRAPPYHHHQQQQQQQRLRPHDMPDEYPHDHEAGYLDEESSFLYQHRLPHHHLLHSHHNLQQPYPQQHAVGAHARSHHPGLLGSSAPAETSPRKRVHQHDYASPYA